ncbi:MAG: winged helix-turn-helix domain-containing protein [Oscillospiraceae bacterium]
MEFRQIQAPTLRELFVDQVIGMIFSGELKVGDRLPSERELSEQMHISRSMVHTGLEDLERMGFVRMEPRRGNYIEDYARHGNFETLMALAKYGGEIRPRHRELARRGARRDRGRRHDPARRARHAGGYAAAACHYGRAARRRGCG